MKTLDVLGGLTKPCMWSVLTASPTYVVNSMCHEEMHHQVQSCEDLWFYRACLAPTLLFVTGISAPLCGLIM
jgi:hypothetical protein